MNNSHILSDYTVPEEWINKRADVFLASLFKGEISRTSIQSDIRQGVMFINSVIVSNPKYLLKAGDKISFSHQIATPLILTAAKITLDIVFENEHLAVINKDAGLVTHPGAGNRENTLVNALINHFGIDNLCKKETDRPGIVHRLDQETSGLMVIAKTDKAYLSLSEQISSKTCIRKYLAICYGVVVPSSGTIETFLKPRVDDHRYFENSVHELPGSKLAISNYKTLKILLGGHMSLVQMQLQTGRTHQIRAHLLYKHHPLAGEKIYTKPSYKSLPTSIDSEIRQLINSFPRQALHSHYLSFIDPESGDKLEFSSELPEDMATLLEQIGE